MHTVLQGLQELEGVLGTIVLDNSGQVMAAKAHPAYDTTLLQQASRTIANAADAIQLLHEDWEGVTAGFSDGKLLIRNLKPTGQPVNRARILAVIADARLNPSFAGVALRVAVSKLKSASDPGASMPGAASGFAPMATSPIPPPPPLGAPPAPQMFHQSTPIPPMAHDPRGELGSTGHSWSGLSGSSSVASSAIEVADAASSAFLTACTKALAQAVGPMAKVYVKEAVRRLWPDKPFSRNLRSALAAELEKHIEDPKDLAKFRNTVRTL